MYRQLSITLLQHRDNFHFHSDPNEISKIRETLYRLPQPVHLGPVSTRAANKLLSSNRDSGKPRCEALLDPRLIKNRSIYDLKDRGDVINPASGDTRNLVGNANTAAVTRAKYSCNQRQRHRSSLSSPRSVTTSVHLSDRPINRPRVHAA